MSVDDYGTGYSSLIYLKVFPVSELKIDEEFTYGLTRNRSDASIVQSATDLGHNLGLTVVAEGVEDLATLTALEASGVDVAQGFHVGRPMPEGVLHQWIIDRKSTTNPEIDLLTDPPAEDSHHIAT